MMMRYLSHSVAHSNQKIFHIHDVNIDVRHVAVEAQGHEPIVNCDICIRRLPYELGQMTVSQLFYNQSLSVGFDNQECRPAECGKVDDQHPQLERDISVI